MQKISYQRIRTLSVILKLVRVAVIVIATWLAIGNLQEGKIFPAFVCFLVIAMGLFSLWRSVVRWNRIKNQYRK